MYLDDIWQQVPTLEAVWFLRTQHKLKSAQDSNIFDFLKTDQRIKALKYIKYKLRYFIKFQPSFETFLDTVRN